jgi:hypothetical protein
MTYTSKQIRDYLNEYATTVKQWEMLNAFADLLDAAPKAEPVAWQFFQDGKWHNGMNTNDHRKNTETAGIPTRDLYAAIAAVKEQGK